MFRFMMLGVLALVFPASALAQVDGGDDGCPMCTGEPGDEECELVWGYSVEACASAGGICVEDPYDDPPDGYQWCYGEASLRMAPDGLTYAPAELVAKARIGSTDVGGLPSLVVRACQGVIVAQRSGEFAARIIRERSKKLTI